MKDNSVSDWGVAGAIVLGHKLGHAYVGLVDPFNYKNVENPIRQAFGVPRRERYDDVYADVPYEWIGPGTMFGIAQEVTFARWRADRDLSTRAAAAFTIAWSCFMY